MTYIKFLWRWLLDLAGAALFAWGIARAVAIVAEHAIARDGLAPPNGFALVLLLPSGMIVLGAMLRAGAAFSIDSTAVRLAQAASHDHREHLWPRLLGVRLPRPLPTGESATLALDHVTALENREVRFTPARIVAGIGPLLIAALVALASWVAALIMVLTLIPFVLGMILAGTAARRASERQLAALGAMSGLFVDRITHLPLIRHFGAEARLSRQVRGATAEVAGRTVAVLRVAFLSSAVMEFFAALSIALVAVYCGFSLLHLLPFTPPETLTLQRAFFVLAMAPEFYLPMRRLAAAYHEKQLGEAAEKALEPYTAAPMPAAQVAPQQSSFSGVVVDNLVLRFPGVDLGPLTFRVCEGDLVALTGPTGSGKTSTLAALAGQLDPASGQVTDARGEPLDPAHIAWAAQRPLLVTGTLERNLALAAPHADTQTVLAAALRVGLGPLLDQRGGLDLILDHAGSGLSGGERRRIGLARAILSGRPLILCDEPTADLDAQSAARIVELLQELARDHGVLVATHDRTLAHAAKREIAL